MAQKSSLVTNFILCDAKIDIYFQLRSISCCSEWQDLIALLTWVLL